MLLAHRGLPSADRPENTVAAVRAAFAAGADGVEVDVRLTADGVLAVCHDAHLGRTAGTPLPVASSSWSSLRDTADRRGVALARAEELLVVAAGRPVVLEAKQPPPGPAAAARTALAIASLLRSLQRQAVPLDVTVSSFSPRLAEHVRRLLPPTSGVRTALLGDAFVRPASLVRQALAAGHDEAHPHLLALLADPGSVAAAHACGVAVVPWTVNLRRDVRRLAGLGVDAVITDVPATARAAVGGSAPVA
jgi:glycerophosphoryl diester phosphodiesterase